MDLNSGVQLLSLIHRNTTFICVSEIRASIIIIIDIKAGKLLE